MNDADKTKRIIAMMTDEKPAKFFTKPGCLNCESAVCDECNATAAKDAEIAALRAEVERLRGLVVSRFDQDGPPTFRQGTPENELEDPVTAEHCAWFVAEIKRLRAEVERLHEQLRLATVDQAIAEAEASDAHAENKRLQEAFVAQQPAIGEEIMVNAAHDVYILPLQPSGLSSGPRFVVHVPPPEPQAAQPAASAVPVAWVAADTLNSPHPTCVSSLAYMSQLDKDRGREYVPLYAAPVAAQVPEGMIERIKAAEQRILDGHAPRRIPADPTDVDLVLAEVRLFLEGKPAPFWLAAAPAPKEGEAP